MSYWAIFSNPAVQLQVCHNKVEIGFEFKEFMYYGINRGFPREMQIAECNKMSREARESVDRINEIFREPIVIRNKNGKLDRLNDS